MSIPTDGKQALATATNPSAVLTDPSLFVVLSRLDSGWWGDSNTSDGARGRACKLDGTELACDWINFDNTASTGLLRVKWSGDLETSGSQQIYVFPPNTRNISYSASDTYGSDNAYDSYWAGYWPTGGGSDRTSNGADISANGVTWGDSTGKIGDATNFTPNGYGSSTDSNLLDIPDDNDWSLFFWFNSDDVQNYRAAAFFNGTYSIEILPNDNASGSGGTRVYWGGSGNIVNESGSDLSGTWHNEAIIVSSSTDLKAYRDASEVGSYTSARSAGGYTTFYVGANVPNGAYYDGLLQEIQIHSIARSEDWVSYEYDQANDNATFWGTWVTSDVSGGSIVPVLQSNYRRRRLS